MPQHAMTDASGLAARAEAEYDRWLIMIFFIAVEYAVNGACAMGCTTELWTAQLGRRFEKLKALRAISGVEGESTVEGGAPSAAHNPWRRKRAATGAPGSILESHYRTQRKDIDCPPAETVALALIMIGGFRHDK